jgi:hypothetical protein
MNRKTANFGRTFIVDDEYTKKMTVDGFDWIDSSTHSFNKQHTVAVYMFS